MPIRTPLIRGGAVLAGLTLIAGSLTFAASASADALSPNTGARVTTSGNPTAGSGGTVYYVDATSGNNANSGTSTGSAWQSLAKVNSFNFVAGDVIAFKRGQTFSGSATIDNAGTSMNFITITAYGSGASLAISSGANPKAVQRMLGHASAAMTLDTYANLFEDDLDAVSDRMDKVRADAFVGFS